MRYHLITLGCQMNISDGGRVRSIIEEMGYEWTEHEEEANLVGILACSVRQKPIDKVYARIQKWNKWKKHKNLITFISGCILPSDKKKLLKLFDIIFLMSELSKLPELISNYGMNTHPSMLGMPKNNMINYFWNIKPMYNSSFEAYVPIQNGCDKFCTYCAVPFTRGREVSRLSNEILEEVISLVKKGYKSITLLGQNVNSYGIDKKGNEITFAQLLEQIGEFGKMHDYDFWIYFTSPHPRDMSRDVVETVAKYKCLAKQMHLPLQSGDDEVLEHMNRNHSVEKYRKIIQDVRELIPQATIFTDIIVGFSGETDSQFQNTVKAMYEFNYNMAYIAMYSPRPGAKSSRWDDDISVEVKKERYHELSKVLVETSSVEISKFKDKTVKILVTKRDRKPEFLTGYTEGKIIVRFSSDNDDLIGRFVNVKIDSTHNFSCQGQLV